MYEISQRYGVKLKKLLKRNKMVSGQEPLKGENIILKGKRYDSPILRNARTENNKIEEKPKEKATKKIKKEKSKTNPKALFKKDKKSKEEVKEQKKVKDNSKPQPKEKSLFKKKKSKTHIVKKGETLYRISKMYEVAVDDIKKWNKLKNNTLEVGQELIIKK
jgi:LysM repeat protein